MQTKNSTQTVGSGAKSELGSSTTIKSFNDLGSAVLDRDIDQFAEQYRKGADCWMNAGKKLIEMTNKHPEAMTRIRERTGLSDAILQTFARIGRGEIWPPLLVDSSIGARKLLECNYDDQKKYAEQPIEIAIEWKLGNIKTIKKKVSDLSRTECASVFGLDGNINNLEQQAFRLRSGTPEKKVSSLKPTDPAPEYAKPRHVNVDIGYFSVVQHPNGAVICEPCEKSAMAQPVRVISNGKGFKSAIVLYYKQEIQ